MKKILFSTLVLAAVATGAQAQNLSLGPIVGLNHSWMSNAGNKAQFNPGLGIGATLTYSFNPKWGVGADLKYSMEGVKTMSENTLTTTIRDANLNYVRFQPKLIRFFGDLGDRIRPKIYVGPSVGFLTGGKIITDVEPKQGGAVITTESLSKDSYNKVDAGLFAGAGLNYRIGKAMWLNTDLNYNHGLVDVAKSNVNSATRALSFNVGITFPIGTVNPE